VSGGPAPTAAARPPGRHRSAAADAAIVRAALQTLVEDGYRSLSMEKVGRLAGVGKATLYRRFASKAELAKAAILHLHQGLEAPADTGSFLGDLAALQEAVLTAGRTSGAPLLLPRLLSEAAEDPELHAIFRRTLVDPRRVALRTVIDRGVARGEIRADVDAEALTDLLTAPYIYRLLIDAGDVSGAVAQVGNYLEIILRGAAAR
jgi:AcrR family transcriptional regulator